jgi:hypothetical protein
MGDSPRQRPKWIGIWKLIVGLALVFAGTRALLRPARDFPAALQYPNETQRIAGGVTQFVIVLLGAGLILLWIRSVWIKPHQ